MGRLVEIDLSFIQGGQRKGTFRVGIDIALTLQSTGEKVLCITGCKEDEIYLNKIGLKAKFINFGSNKYLAIARRWLYFRFRKTRSCDKIIFVGTHRFTKKTNSISVIHDLYIKDLPSNYRIDQRFYYKYISMPNAMNGKIIVMTKHLKRRLVKEFKVKPEKIFVYNYMMNIKTQQKSNWRQKLPSSVLIVSSAVKNKNIATMPLVLKRLSESIRQKLNVFIVSQTVNIESSLKKDCSEVLESVDTYMNITDEDLMDLYRKCFYYLTTSIIEGFGLGTREAYFNKCMIICPMTETNREASCDSAMYYSEKIELLGSIKTSDTKITNATKSMLNKNKMLITWLGR